MLPQVQHLLLGDILHPFRTALSVPRVEPGKQLAQEQRGVDADLTFLVHEKFIQEAESLLLLGVVRIGEILTQDVDVGADVLPVLLAACRLQQVSETPLRGHLVHDVDVVLDGHEHQGLYDLFGCPEPGHGKHFRRRRIAVQFHIHPVAPHVGLEIRQFGVDKAIAGDFIFIHIEELVEDDVKGIFQGGNVGDLHAVRPAARFHAEIRIDEAQGLHGQVLRLQIPGGVVRCDVADVGKVMAFGPQGSVVVMHEGHFLVRLASELAQVMGRRRAGDQRQVHGRTGGMEPPGDGHRHVMHSRDVLQGLELRDLRVQAHHLVDIFPVPVLQESSVLLSVF